MTAHSLAVRRRSEEDLDDCVRLLRLVHDEDGYPRNWPSNPRSWLAPDDQVETFSFKRSNWWEPVRQECLAVRDRVGLMDLSTFAKFEVAGSDADVAGRDGEGGRVANSENLGVVVLAVEP